MFDKWELLAGGPLVQVWHKDPCKDGTDSSCRRALMHYPYDGDEEAFTRDHGRAGRRQWLHLHHLRLRRGWRLRKRPNLEPFGIKEADR